MIKVALALSVITALSYAESIDVLIREALQNNPSLISAQARVEESRFQKEISKNLDNPSLQLQVNDIQTQDITNRSIEPMQFTTLSLQQKLPFAGKRDLRYEDAQAQETFAGLSLSQSRALLSSEIKKEVYRLWQIGEEERIYSNFEIIVRQNGELYTALSSSAAAGRHMGIMSSQMDLSQIKIIQADLAQEKERSYANLSQLCAKRIEKVDVDLNMGQIEPIESYKKSLENNFGYRAKDAQLKSAGVQLRQSQLDAYPDVTVQAGYSRREAFNDFWSVGVNIPLPVYGTESVKEQINREKVLERSRDKEAAYLQLEASMRQKYAEMRKASEVWKVIHDESLPQLNHMFELSEASIRNGEDLFRFTELLKQKLQLELQQSRSVATFYRAQAELDLLVGKE
ncbi:MAG: TolC family protein [Sulfuricurvum sp.]|uniref:TolC family protein n=1 Tax=Sulfuricurvum sp. TaxID=2025608 RepID=UPI002632C712|nr:TolC family protein [Sulfuricurvum sp.]MDD5160756.1 TolC family protein [Sulfuricurvum sp.]